MRFQTQLPYQTGQLGESIREAVGEKYLIRVLIFRKGILETQLGVVSLQSGVYVGSFHNVRSTVSYRVSSALPHIIILLSRGTNPLSIAKETVSFGEIANVELDCASFARKSRYVNTEVKPLVVTTRVRVNPHEKVVHVRSNFYDHI